MSRKFALIIGNSEYEDTKLARLVTPGADVSALAKVLRAPEIGGFDEVTLLVDQMESVVRRAIARFFAQKGRDDLLLLYFSGHGVLDDQGQLYLAMKDTEHDLLSATGIPAALITREMDNSLPRRQVLILDCCHSGAFARGAKGTPGASVGTAAAFEGNGYGRVVLTATDSTQYAWEGNEIIGQAENSVFTHHLVQGLQTGEADADGQITLDELYNYVYERMVNATRRQTPGKWSYRQQGEIALAKNPRPVVKPVALPPELQHALESPFAAVREGVVRELDRLWRGSDPGLALAARTALESLKEDDSRRVSAAAAEILAGHVEPQHPGEERADIGGKADVTTSTSRQGAVLGKSPAREYVEQGGTRDTGAESKQPLDTRSSPPVPAKKIWLSLLLAFIGWAIGGVFAIALGVVIADEIGPYYHNDNYSRYYGNWAEAWAVGAAIGGAIVALIGGFMTGLALRRSKPSVRWRPIVMATTYGTIALSLIGAIGAAIGGAEGWEEGAVGWVIGAVIAGAIWAGVTFRRVINGPRST
jgi:Caspase domain